MSLNHNDYLKKKEEMLATRKAQVGDKISAIGETCTIEEIFYNDRYVESKDGKYEIFYDIEFRDTNGIHRHWKSYFDGGQLILVDKPMSITEPQAREFYRDLCSTVYGDSNKTSQGIMSVGLIAEHMNITVESATEFCNAMLKYGITERQGGMIVV